jgi:hypothetical protein
MHDLVERHTKKAGHHLLPGDFLAVAQGPCVGSDRLLSLVGQLAVRPDLDPQGGREAFALGIARFIVDDDGDDAIAPP